MFSDAEAARAIGQTAYDNDRQKLGKVGQVFLDDQSGQPEFVTVNTGLFGTSESFVPTQGATFDGEDLHLAFGKDQVKDAPKIDLDGDHLDQAEEDRLYSHSGLGAGAGTGVGTDGRRDDLAAGRTQSGVGTGPDAGRTDTAYGDDGVVAGQREPGQHESAPVAGQAGQVGQTGQVGHDTSGPTTDEAMTRSKEHLEVGTTTQEAGRARLRKYVTTEEETVTVPVRKERAVLETEPITDANVGDATGGPAISEEEHEVVLHEERAVADTVTTPVERVRLGTETEVQDETVTGEVREEHVEVEGDVDERPR